MQFHPPHGLENIQNDCWGNALVQMLAYAPEFANYIQDKETAKGMSSNKILNLIHSYHDHPDNKQLGKKIRDLLNPESDDDDDETDKTQTQQKENGIKKEFKNNSKKSDDVKVKIKEEQDVDKKNKDNKNGDNTKNIKKSKKMPNASQEDITEAFFLIISKFLSHIQEPIKLTYFTYWKAIPDDPEISQYTDAEYEKYINYADTQQEDVPTKKNEDLWLLMIDIFDAQQKLITDVGPEIIQNLFKPYEDMEKKKRAKNQVTEKLMMYGVIKEQCVLNKPLPPFLFVSLKRWIKYPRFMKSDQIINMPRAFYLSSDRGKVDDQNINGVEEQGYYIIKSFCLHMGSISGGHYVAFVKSGEEDDGGDGVSWYKCNDTRLTPYKEDNFPINDFNKGYLYYYEKVDKDEYDYEKKKEEEEKEKEAQLKKKRSTTPQKRISTSKKSATPTPKKKTVTRYKTSLTSILLTKKEQKEQALRKRMEELQSTLRPMPEEEE